MFRRAIDVSDDAQLVVELLRQIKFSIDKLMVYFILGCTGLTYLLLLDYICHWHGGNNLGMVFASYTILL
jgi:hypothetical protein